MPDPDEQLRRLLLNVDRVAPEEELAGRLAEGRPLRVKLGLDPTAPSVTLGWAVVLRKLRQFQELGHTAVLIVGDFTAQVGDPSLKTETRRRLTAEEVRGYAESVLGGFSRILLPEPLEIRWNSEWLASMDMEHVLELTSATTVAQMLERADFAERMVEQRPISVLEFIYPLLQGYDSVAVEADVELGGSDQLWNLLMGRTVQQRYAMRPQVAMTMPLLLGTDGVNKMSQSLDNYVAVDAEPADMFGKVMSVPDGLMQQWFRLATEVPAGETEAIISGIADGSVHPAEAKRRLGREVVGLYWGRRGRDRGGAGLRPGLPRPRNTRGRSRTCPPRVGPGAPARGSPRCRVGGFDIRSAPTDHPRGDQGRRDTVDRGGRPPRFNRRRVGPGGEAALRPLCLRPGRTPRQ